MQSKKTESRCLEHWELVRDDFVLPRLSPRQNERWPWWSLMPVVQTCLHCCASSSFLTSHYCWCSICSFWFSFASLLQDLQPHQRKRNLHDQPWSISKHHHSSKSNGTFSSSILGGTQRVSSYSLLCDLCHFWQSEVNHLKIQVEK